MINLFKKYKWIGAGFFGLLLTVLTDNFFDITDKVNNYFISKEVKEFSNRSYIKEVKSEDGKTRITYHTCFAPKLNYNIAVTVNGELKYESPEFKAIKFGSDYTDTCQTWTGKTFDFGLKTGDKLVIIWDYGQYGSFEMVFIK